MKNYVDLLTSESFYNSLFVTVVFVVIVVIGSMLIGLIPEQYFVVRLFSWNSSIQYILCASNGDCFQWSGNDF